MSAFIHCLLLCKANWGKERGISPKKASFVHPEGAERGFATSVFIGQGGGVLYNIGWYGIPLPKIFAAFGGQGGVIKPAVGGGMFLGCRGGVSQHIPIQAPMYVWLRPYCLFPSCHG